MIWFNILEFSRISHRLHQFLHLLQLGSDVLNSLVIFLNFCIENSSTCCSCALFMFPISCLLQTCVSRRAFSFRNNSSCNRICSRLDSTNSFCTSCSALLWSSVRFVNHLCTYWVTRHEFLFWLDLILPDSASDLYCLRAEFHSNSTDSFFRPQNSTFGFSVHHVLVKAMQQVSQKLYDLLMNETFCALASVSLSWTTNAAGCPEALWAYDEWDVCALASLLNDHCIWFPWRSLGIQWWSQQLL